MSNQDLFEPITFYSFPPNVCPACDEASKMLKNEMTHFRKLDASASRGRFTHFPAFEWRCNSFVGVPPSAEDLYCYLGFRRGPNPDLDKNCIDKPPVAPPHAVWTWWPLDPSPCSRRTPFPYPTDKVVMEEFSFPSSSHSNTIMIVGGIFVALALLLIILVVYFFRYKKIKRK